MSEFGVYCRSISRTGPAASHFFTSKKKKKKKIPVNLYKNDEVNIPVNVIKLCLLKKVKISRKTFLRGLKLGKMRICHPPKYTDVSLHKLKRLPLW